jgi:archaellum component FlaC
MVKSQQLKTITKEEDGKEVVYILQDNSTPSQAQDATIQEDTSKQTPLQDEITQLKSEVSNLTDEVKKLRSELNRLKVTVFKMAKEDAKVLKI